MAIMSAALAMSLACRRQLELDRAPLRIDEGWILVVSPPRERRHNDLDPPFSVAPCWWTRTTGGVDHLDVAVVSLCDRVHQPIQMPALRQRLKRL